MRITSLIIASITALVLLAAPASATSVNSHRHCHHMKHHPRHGWVAPTYTWGARQPHDMLLTPFYCGSHAAYLIG
jgi:hypothetical protein